MKIENKKILIIGGGNIGLHLAKMLEENFQDARVKIIEKNKIRAEEIANELSSSIVINGDALEFDYSFFINRKENNYHIDLNYYLD